MPVGARDFQNGQNAGTPGDIVSRIVSGAGAYHPTGTWALFDDFEGVTPLIKWQTVITGGGTVTIDNTQAYRGTNCLKCTTGALVSVQSGISKIIPITTDLIGIDCMINMVPAGGTSVIGLGGYLTMNVGQGIRQFQATIQANYLGSSGLTSFFLGSDIGPNPTFASNLNITWSAARWHNYKMIYDMTNQKYVRFYFDNFVYDLSSFTPSHQGLAIQPDIGKYVQVQVFCSTAAAVAETVRYDDVIVTFNES